MMDYVRSKLRVFAESALTASLMPKDESYVLN